MIFGVAAYANFGYGFTSKGIEMAEHVAFGVTLTGVVASAASYVFAQVSGVPELPTGWIGALSQVSSVGFCLWYAWYTSTVTLPAKDKQFTDALDKIQQQHDEWRKESMASFRESLAQVLERHRADKDDVVQRMMAEKQALVAVLGKRDPA